MERAQVAGMSGLRYAVALGTLVAAVLAVESMVGRAVPLTAPLATLPFSLGGWTGQSMSAPAEVVRRTRPDDVLSRRYLDTQGDDAQIYVGYYSHEAARAQILALCEDECQVVRTGTTTIAVPGGRETVNRALVQHDGVDYVVLYWFQYGPQVVHDASRAKLGLAWRALTEHRSDGALVRVSSRVFTTEAAAAEHAVTFTELLFPALRHFLPS
jgi:EpsI family protein